MPFLSSLNVFPSLFTSCIFTHSLKLSWRVLSSKKHSLTLLKIYLFFLMAHTVPCNTLSQYIVFEHFTSVSPSLGCKIFEVFLVLQDNIFINNLEIKFSRRSTIFDLIKLGTLSKVWQTLLLKQLFLKLSLK